MRRRSLTLGIVFPLLLTLFVGTFLIWVFLLLAELAGLLGDGHFGLSDISEAPVRRLIIDSLTRLPDGRIAIEPSRELGARIDRTPSLEFAVFNNEGRSLLGGSSNLERALIWIKSEGRPELLTTEMQFRLNGGQRNGLIGSLSKENTPFGWLFIAVYGYHFELSDLGFHVRNTIIDTMSYYAPLFLLAGTIAWFTVWRGLSPLRHAAADASKIDIDHLHQRLSTERVPTEILPFIDALNDALARLDAGVARERRFIANAAHELRTPIAILRARIENPQEDRFRKDLRRHLRRLQSIVEALLATARISQKAETSIRVVDLGEVALQKVADYTPLLMENDRRIDFEAPECQIFAWGDRSALESIIGNLLDNALRVEPDGGLVIVRVKPGPILEICDHGIGIAEHDRRLVFEPFWRKTEVGAGSGLGLSIVKELVELLGGKILITDTPSGGTTFVISLRSATNDCA